MEHFHTGNCQFIDEDFPDAVEVKIFILFVRLLIIYSLNNIFLLLSELYSGIDSNS